MLNQSARHLLKEWSELEAAGIPLEPLENRFGLDARNSGTGLTIRLGSDFRRSEIREMKNGCFAYTLPVFVRRDAPGKTIIRDWWIQPPWPEGVLLLDDPKDKKRVIPRGTAFRATRSSSRGKTS